MSIKTVARNRQFEQNGVDAMFDVISINGHTIEVSVRIGRGGLRGTHAGNARFDKPTSGTIVAAAEKTARQIVDEVVAESEREFVYVVIDDLPGFSSEMLGRFEDQTAGYWMDSTRGVPVTVVKAKDYAESEEVAKVVETMGVIVDGGRRFAPKVAQFTVYAFEALGGSSWHANDAATFLAAERTEDAVIEVG